MKTEELEARLRESLRSKAEEITDADLNKGSMSGAATVGRRAPRAVWQSVATAAAVLVVVALVAAGLSGRAGRDSMTTPQLGNQPDGGAEVSMGPRPRAWPLTNDEPLPGRVPADNLRTPESAARTFLTDAVGLPADWPIDDVRTDGSTAVASYVLQDAPGSISLAVGNDGFWYVDLAQTEMLSPGAPVITERGLDLSVRSGPRTYENGSPIMVSVLRADGGLLVGVTGYVRPQGDGQAGAAEVFSLEWADPELAAAVRVEVLDDHDGDSETADAVIGHWTTGIEAPAVEGLPSGVDLSTTAPVYTWPGSADQVVQSYIQNRFPDFPAPGITLTPARTRARRAFATWSTNENGEAIARGQVVLRQEPDGWSVVAAMTDGVDISALHISEGRLVGQITSTNDNSLFLDVLRDDGRPTPDSPNPEGRGGNYSFGTGGGPATGQMTVGIDMEAGVGHVVIQVRLVGGTFLSISEVDLVVPG